MSQLSDGSVNSNLYWDGRFGTDWESNLGREQTSFFARVALNHMPAWLLRDIRRESLGVCDWGCAEGDGVDVLASSLGVRVTGVDFSESAINKARAYYPARNFVHCDYLVSDNEDRFDIVFSSNTLEHFSLPWDVLPKVARHAKKLVVLMVPFQEYERIHEHFATFDYDNIPFSIPGFCLVHAQVVDTSAMRPSYWGGKQILLVYSTFSYLAGARLLLSDVRFDHAEYLKSLLAVQVAELDLARQKEKAQNQEIDIANEISKKDSRIESLEVSLIEAGKEVLNRDARIGSLEASLLGATNEVLKRDVRIGSFEIDSVDAANQIAERDLRIIQARGEIAKRDARIYTLESRLAELDLVKSSRSWRWTRPVRLLFRVIRQRGFSKSDLDQLRQRVGLHRTSAVHSAGAAVPVATPLSVSTYLVPRLLGKRDFFVWAVIDWHFRIQRPQHLARELAAAGHRVFYISNNFVDRPDPGFSVEPLTSDGRLFQIHLHLLGSPAIYHAAPDADGLAQLRAGIGELLAWTESGACASLVEHPYWLETAETLPNHRMVYDCMDHHGGFADNTDEVLVREKELMRDADLLVVTSDWLYKEVGKENPQRMMIRNACQFEHFAEGSAEVFADEFGRKVIGYYGAIAEWFDLELVEKVARRFSDCLVLLVGADTSGAQGRLRELDNVCFTGEVPYDRLPFYLEGFDVCLLPFKVIPLTLATNPVKVYEYLSAGKEVVSIELPEIRQFGDLVRTGNDHDSFILAVNDALSAKLDAEEIARRRRFAATQTWAHRVQDLLRGIEALPEPRVSVVVVTYNNLDLTKACLHSLEAFSDYANLEVIVVDNASADETPAFLREWAAASDGRKIIMNNDNRGFAAANNQGLSAASGDYLVMLNNDTYVTPGWIATLVGHMRRSATLGLLGPVTNNIGNAARIEIRYDSMDEMLQLAGDYTRRHAGLVAPLHTAAFFCVMMPRHVYEKVGELDEVFGVGFFEDDDYCRRIEQAGWSIACAEDVFVHHNLSASFNKMKQEKRQALFERNKAIYEAKWGSWVAHKYRGG